MDKHRVLLYQTVHLKKLIDESTDRDQEHLLSVAQQWVDKVARLSERLAESENIEEALREEVYLIAHLTKAVNKIIGELC